MSRLGSCDDDESWVRSALDHIVGRERKAAEKEGRQPNYLAPEITVEASQFPVAQLFSSLVVLTYCMLGLLLCRGRVRVDFDHGAVDAQVHGR